jgi:hypothetical protein
MANQVEATKVIAFTLTGPDDDEAVSSKVVAYMIVSPGESAVGASRQAHVYSRVVRR